MRKVFSFLLILALVLSLGAFASAEEPDWIRAYSAVLDEKQAEIEAMETEIGFSSGDGYTLYDIDKDGVPELIVKLGTCEADYHGEIYSAADGKAIRRVDEWYIGHSSLYTDPGENGLIVMHGHMGYAEAYRLTLGENGAESEVLYEDNLNDRLEADPNADYIYPEEYIPGAAYLTLYRMDLRLPLTCCEELQRCLEGRFPVAADAAYPQGDPEFFSRIMNENREVMAFTADGYTTNPGRIAFQDLLRQDTAALWMSGDLQIVSVQYADLNGDGQLECLVDLSEGENGLKMRFFLSEQDGTVYTYLQNYVPDELTVDRNGNLFGSTTYYSELSRLFFNGEEAMFLTLPLNYFAA